MHDTVNTEIHMFLFRKCLKVRHLNNVKRDYIKKGKHIIKKGERPIIKWV